MEWEGKEGKEGGESRWRETSVRKGENRGRNCGYMVKVMVVREREREREREKKKRGMTIDEKRNI